MSKLKLHVVSRPEFIATNFADFQELIDQKINPDDIPHRFYCGGRGVWTFQKIGRADV